MTDIQKNFLYNMILTVGNYILPLITYPYISRTLGVENIGVCNYVDSIINYFVLFSALGVGSLGVREIARTKGDKMQMTEVYSSLLSFNVVMTIASVIVLVVLTLLLPSLVPYKPFLLIGIIKLLFSALLIEWFFQGISSFKYITIRSLIIKVVYVVSVFIFVHTQNDTLLYYLLTIFVIAINAIVNLRHSKKFVHFKPKSINIKKFLIPIISYGIYRVLTSMYTTFNVTYLGSVTDATEVGLFSTATKLHGIFLSVFTAFTTVMVPKVSELLWNGNRDKLYDIAQKTLGLVYSLTIPLIILCYYYAPLIIRIIAGPGYEGAITPFRTIIVLLLVIGLEQVIIQQFLMAVKDSKCVLILSLTGAVVGVVTNIILVPILRSEGSAVSWVMSELSVLIVSLFFFYKYFKINILSSQLFIYLLASVPYVAVCSFLCDNELSIRIVFVLLLFIMWFILLNYVIYPNNVLKGMSNDVLKHLRRSKE